MIFPIFPSGNKKKDYEDNYKKKAIAVANKNKPENSFNNQSDSSRINSPNTITDDGEQKAIYNKKVGHPIKRTILESLTTYFKENNRWSFTEVKTEFYMNN